MKVQARICYTQHESHLTVNTYITGRMIHAKYNENGDLFDHAVYINNNRYETTRHDRKLLQQSFKKIRLESLYSEHNKKHTLLAVLQLERGEGDE